MVLRADELLGPFDPAALAACAGAGVFAALRSPVGDAEVVVAPGNAVGVDQGVAGAGEGPARGGGRCRSEGTVDSHLFAELADEALQDLHRVAAGIDVHVEDGRAQRFGQQVDARLVEIVADEDVGCLFAGERLDVVRIHVAVAVEVEPEAFHGVDGDAELCCAARIVRVVDIAALAPDDFVGDLSNCLHGVAPVGYFGRIMAVLAVCFQRTMVR